MMFPPLFTNRPHPFIPLPQWVDLNLTVVYCEDCGGTQGNPLHWDHLREWQLLLDDHWDGGVS